MARTVKKNEELEFFADVKVLNCTTDGSIRDFFDFNGIKNFLFEEEIISKDAIKKAVIGNFNSDRASFCEYKPVIKFTGNNEAFISIVSEKFPMYNTYNIVKIIWTPEL